MASPFDTKDLETPPKNELPPELKGKSPEELAKMVTDARAEAATAKASSAAQEARLNDLTETIKKLNPVVVPPREPAKEPDWFTDPQAAAERMFNAKISPLVETYMNTQEVTQLAEVSKLPYFGDYEKEIKETAASVAPGARLQPNFYKTVYDLVLGRHLGEVMTKEETRKQKEKDAPRPEFTETRSAGGVRRSSEPEISEDERRVAEGMGVPIEKYVAWRDKPGETAVGVLTAKRS